MPSVETWLREKPIETSDGEHERFAHVVVPAAAVTMAAVTGLPCRALCGKVWVPTRDPRRYPICPTCREIVERAGGTVPEA